MKQENEPKIEKRKPRTADCVSLNMLVDIDSDTIRKAISENLSDLASDLVDGARVAAGSIRIRSNFAVDLKSADSVTSITDRARRIAAEFENIGTVTSCSIDFGRRPIENITEIDPAPADEPNDNGETFENV